MQMIGVAEDYLGVNIFQIIAVERFDRRLGADRHERGRQNIAMVSGNQAGSGFAVSVLVQGFEKWHIGAILTGFDDLGKPPWDIMWLITVHDFLPLGAGRTEEGVRSRQHHPADETPLLASPLVGERENDD